jgi:hypothetical protein
MGKIVRRESVAFRGDFPRPRATRAGTACLLPVYVARTVRALGALRTERRLRLNHSDGGLIVTVLGGLAEFERELIRARTGTLRCVEPSEPETVPDEGILGRPLSAAAAQVARARLLCGFRKGMGSGKLENLARYAARGDRPSGKGGRLAELGHSPLARDLGVSDRTVRRWACFS